MLIDHKKYQKTWKADFCNHNFIVVQTFNGLEVFIFFIKIDGELLKWN